LNLASTFLEFARKANGLSASMALLVHHWKEVLELWLEAMVKTDEEGLKPLLEYVQSGF
jgi:U3 small nucleolar RNA-associated protein 20